MIEIEVPYSTVESVTAVVETIADPTAGAVEFLLTEGYAPAAGAAWVAGSWSVAWDSSSMRAAALSPNIGDGEALPLVQGRTYALWMKWNVGDDAPIREVAKIAAT